MSTPTTDYNQQLLAYLQTWRQLLEQWTAMAAGFLFPTAPSVMPGAPAGGPFTPPMVPFMPPIPPTTPLPPMSPAPADYTQQLFSYLQAWRQYLEQMTGARPGSPQPPAAQPQTAQPANDGGNAPPARPPDVPISPGDDTGSKSVPGSDVSKGSNPTWPPLVDLPPTSYSQSQISGPRVPFDRGLEEPQVLNPPDYDFGYQLSGPRGRPTMAGHVVSSAPREAARQTWEAAPQGQVGSPFQSVVERVEPIASPPLAPRSLFSSPGAQTASASFGEAGQTPSP